MPCNPPIEVLEIIASYMELQPVNLTRLAGVNRKFYQFFTSDKFWAKFDVYDVKSEIYRHFVGKSPSKLTKFFWETPWVPLPHKSHLADATSNKYDLLGWVASLQFERPESITDDSSLEPILLDFHLLKLAFHISSNLPLHCPAIMELPSFYDYFTTEDPGYAIQVSGSLAFDETLLRRLLLNNEWTFEHHPVQYFDSAVRNNREILNIILNSSCPEAVVYLDASLLTEVDPLPIITGKAHFMHKFPEYADNYAVVTEAFKCTKPVILPATNNVLAQLSPDLAKEPEIIRAAIKYYPPEILHGPISWLEEYRQESLDSFRLLCQVHIATMLIKQYVRKLPEMDPDIFQIIVENMDVDYISSLRRVTSKVTDNEAFMEDQIRRNPQAYAWATTRLQERRDFLDLALDNGVQFEQLPERFLDDFEVVARVARQCPTALPPMPDELAAKLADKINLESIYDTAFTGNRAIASAMLKKNKEVYVDLDDYLQGDPEIIQLVLDQCSTVADIPSELLQLAPTKCCDHLELSPEVFRVAANPFKEYETLTEDQKMDVDFMASCVEQNAGVFGQLSRDMCCTPRVQQSIGKWPKMF